MNYVLYSKVVGRGSIGHSLPFLSAENQGFGNQKSPHVG